MTFSGDSMKVIYEKEIDAGKIVVSPRPVWKCRACPVYGKSPSCPPYAPPWQEAKEWIGSFKRALIIKFGVDYENFEAEKREALLYLLRRENELFRDGNPYAFALFPGNCNLCEECKFQKSKKCVEPTKVRFSLCAVGIEIRSFAKVDFSESVLYGIILID